MDFLLDLLTAPLDGINWLTDQIFLFLNGLFDRFGTPIVFVAALVEATVGEMCLLNDEFLFVAVRDGEVAEVKVTGETTIRVN